MVDEDAGVHIRDLRLRELPFMRYVAWRTHVSCFVASFGKTWPGGSMGPAGAGAALHEVGSRLQVGICCRAVAGGRTLRVHIRDLRLRELPFMRCMANAPCTALCIAVQRRHNALLRSSQVLFAQPNCPPAALLCSADTMLYDVLKVFRFGRSHMSALTAPGPTGSHEVRAVGAVPAVPAVCVQLSTCPPHCQQWAPLRLVELGQSN